MVVAIVGVWSLESSARLVDGCASCLWRGARWRLGAAAVASWAWQSRARGAHAGLWDPSGAGLASGRLLRMASSPGS